MHTCTAQGLAWKFINSFMESLSWDPSSVSSCTLQFIGLPLLSPLARKLRFSLPYSATFFLICTQIWGQAARMQREKINWISSHPLGITAPLIREEGFPSSVLGSWRPHCCHWHYHHHHHHGSAWELGHEKREIKITLGISLSVWILEPFSCSLAITRGLLEFSLCPGVHCWVLGCLMSMTRDTRRKMRNPLPVWQCF